MPHRTTYFFPRQFPDRGMDPLSHKHLLTDHEKKSLTAVDGNSNCKDSPRVQKEKGGVNGGDDDPKRKTSSKVTALKEKEKEKEFTSSLLSKSSVVTDLFNGLAGGVDQKLQKKQQQQLAAFYDWLAEKKAEISRSSSARVKPTRLSTSSDIDEDRELLLPAAVEPAPAAPPPAPSAASMETAVTASSSSVRMVGVDERNVDRNFDRQVSLPRLSSESSFAGSFFSGTTVDGNFSSPMDVKEASTSTRVSVTKEVDEDEAITDGEKKAKSMAQKSI